MRQELSHPEAAAQRPSRRIAPKAAAGIALLAAALAAPVPARAGNGYPTTATVDYVIGCMAANGNSREAMRKCSCSIDVIAGLMPYARYEEAETALSMQAANLGERSALFRDPPVVKELLQELRQAQAEATIQCF